MLNKGVCKTCWKSARGEWSREADKEWNNGITICPYTIKGIAPCATSIMVKVAPKWCDYSLEHLMEA